jgi:hypothetical protein
VYGEVDRRLVCARVGANELVLQCAEEIPISLFGRHSVMGAQKSAQSQTTASGMRRHCGSQRTHTRTCTHATVWFMVSYTACSLSYVERV